MAESLSGQGSNIASKEERERGWEIPVLVNSVSGVRVCVGRVAPFLCGVFCIPGLK